MDDHVNEFTVSRLLLLSFLIVILVGAGLLWLPVSQRPAAAPLTWVDALFTATSAVCVTGLTVRDTGATFSGFGQAVILLLIQVGGLGFLTLSTFILTRFFSRRRVMSQPHRLLLETSHGALATVSPAQLLGVILLFTLLVEALGSLLLFVRFAERLEPGAAAWQGVFHAISAFCNAGFGLLADNLIPYRHDLLVNGVVMGMIVLGGLGFLVVADVALWWRARRQGRRVHLTLHSRLVLRTTAWLIVLGAAGFAALEWGGPAMGSQPGEVALASLFLSVTSRTAGFNTVDLGQLTNATLLLVMVLMVIGGSPGSTAGGMKTTTLAVWLALLRSRARARPRVECLQRTIPEATVTKAVLVMTGYLLAVLVGVLLLQLTEAARQPFALAPNNAFLAYLFEVVSALGTVGLSTGLTPNLGSDSKLVLSLLMLVGRVGPLLVASVAIGESQHLQYSYAEENVNIG